MNDSRPVLIYDGACRLCVVSKEVMKRWDKKQHIQFVPAMTRINEMCLVDSEGVVVSGVAAFRNMLPSLPMGWAIGWFFKLPGFLFLATKVYRVIARNRYRWFGAVLQK